MTPDRSNNLSSPERDQEMPGLERILETAIHTDDVERSRRFYEEVMGLKPMFTDQRLTAYDAGGGSVLLVFLRGGSAEPVVLPGGTIPGHGGAGCLHFAFALRADELGAWEGRLREHNIGIEAWMDWPGGGKSIYFRDPDGHLLELATPGLWPNY
jgi:catechol 2,3-dioxygenase-like lactoylglutathione lyase family enzyme